MPFTPRKMLPHEVPPWVNPGAPYFFTLCVQDRESNPLVSESVAAKLLAAARHYHEQHTWYARLFLIMPDHLHAFIAFPVDSEMRKIWQNWRRYTSKATGVVWQRDLFEHRIRSDEAIDEKARYIRENPVRKGLVAEAKLWPWIFEA